MENQNSSEEEWEEMQRRFNSEGLNFTQLSSKQKSLHLFRWLVDAENNMVTSRKMLDKVREQQSEELKEVETYVQHIKNLSTEKLENLEKENAELCNEVEDLRQKSMDNLKEQINSMLTQEGLSEIINSGLEEQVAYLLVLRSRLLEELETEKKHAENEKSRENTKVVDTSQQLLEAQNNFDEEMKHQRELTKRVKEELRKSHDVEIAAYQAKLDAALKKVEQLELERDTRRNSADVKTDDDDDEHLIKISLLKDKVSRMEDRLEKLQHAKRQLEIDNESLTYKVSELFSECEEKEMLLRKEQMKKIGANVIVSNSRRNSTLESPKRVSDSIIDNNLANELSCQQKIRKLQQDVENLQEQLISVGGRHEALSIRYHQRKADGKTKMQRIRDVFQVKQSSLKDQICDLENSLSVVQTRFGWEKECRQKIQSDFASLQKEKEDLLKRLLDCDDNLRDKTLQLKALSLRVNNLEEENAKICQEMAILKTVVLKEMFINSSTQKDSSSKETVASQWLNQLHISTQGVKHSKVAGLKKVNEEEITV